MYVQVKRCAQASRLSKPLSCINDRTTGGRRLHACFMGLRERDGIGGRAVMRGVSKALSSISDPSNSPQLEPRAALRYLLIPAMYCCHYCLPFARALLLLRRELGTAREVDVQTRNTQCDCSARMRHGFRALRRSTSARESRGRAVEQSRYQSLKIR